LASSFTEAYGVNSAGQIVGLYNNATGFHGFLEIAVPNPPPPAGTTADMILRHGADGQYQITVSTRSTTSAVIRCSPPISWAPSGT
jgi:hypothetical protein